jgi:hypothetical protein
VEREFPGREERDGAADVDQNEGAEDDQAGHERTYGGSVAALGSHRLLLGARCSNRAPERDFHAAGRAAPRESIAARLWGVSRLTRPSSPLR